jgi:ABC-type uncharacterized transport system YnjBCD substrate-binding protein
MWGGADNINSFVDQTYGKLLKEQYDITLQRVPITDIAETVNKLLGEKQAGKNSDGSVDLMWINGENFKTARQADLLYGPWALSIPNAKLVPWNEPIVAQDFGFPVEGYESPWGGAQWQYVYNTATVKESELPRSFAALKEWVKAHPGRFTYVAPPAFYRFLWQALYELMGGPDKLLGEFDQAKWQAESPKLWAYMNEIKPYLWRKGETYPKDLADLNKLFANGEVDFTYTFTFGGVASEVSKGVLPPSSKVYVFDNGTIGDRHYLAIPYNSPHKAAAMVLANLVLEPDLQIAKAQPDTWGDGFAIDTKLLSPEAKAKVDAFPKSDASLPPDVLTQKILPSLAAEYDTKVQEDWKTFVLEATGT